MVTIAITSTTLIVDTVSSVVSIVIAVTSVTVATIDTIVTVATITTTSDPVVVPGHVLLQDNTQKIDSFSKSKTLAVPL